MHNLHAIDIAVIISYLIGCLIIGFISSKKIQNIKDYAVGRYVPTVMLIGTFLATDIGAGSTVGVVEKVYSMGLLFAIAIMFKPMFWLIASTLFSKKIEYFRSKGCISVSDIIEVLYGKTARWITNIMAIAMSIGILALQISAMGYLFGYFLDISPTHCALLAFSVLVTYSFFGGIRAIILTDVVQAAIFFIGIPMACFMAYSDLHMSYSEILASLPASHSSIDITVPNVLILLSMILHSMLAIVDGPIVQRYLMASNEKQAKQVFKTCFMLAVPIIFVICFVGMIMKLKAPEINPSTAFFFLIDNYLPVGAKGFLIAGILAAIMSTADSWLNTASVLCAHDILRKIFPKISDKREVLYARLSVLFISAISAYLALNSGHSILGLMWMVDNFWTPVVLVPVVAGFASFRTNGTSFVASFGGAIIFVLIGRYITGEFATVSTSLGVIGCALGLFGAHFVQKLSRKKELEPVLQS